MKFGAVIMLMMASAMLAESAQVKSSFESGDFTGWNKQGEGWTVYAKAASKGEKSAMYTVAKGEEAGLKACARIVENAGPGWVITAQVDIAGKAKSKSSKVNLALMCIDAEGNTLREVKKQVTSPSVKFQKVTLDELIVPSGTKEVYFMMVVEVTQVAKAKEWWRFDNIVIDVK